MPRKPVGKYVGIEQHGSGFRAVARWKGIKPMWVSAPDADSAQSAYDFLRRLYTLGRRDLLAEIEQQSYQMWELETCLGEPAAIEQDWIRTGSPEKIAREINKKRLNPVGELVVQWKSDMLSGKSGRRKRKSYAPGTVKRYTLSLAEFLRVVGKDKPIGAIVQADLDLFVSRRQEAFERRKFQRTQGVTSRTIMRDLTAVQAFFRYISQQHPQVVLPVLNWSIVSEEEREEGLKYLEPADLEKLVAASYKPFSDIFTVLAFTGLRIDELKGLRYGDIDFSGMSIRVGVQGKRQTTKSKSGSRRVPIGESVFPILKKWCERDTINSSTPVLPVGLLEDTNGGRNSYQMIYDAFQYACIKAGLLRAPKKAAYTLHSLRHTYGVLMARAGVPIVDIMKLLGHRDIKTTMIYLDYTDDPEAQIYIQRMEAYVRQKVDKGVKTLAVGEDVVAGVVAVSRSVGGSEESSGDEQIPITSI